MFSGFLVVREFGSCLEYPFEILDFQPLLHVRTMGVPLFLAVTNNIL